MFSTNFMNQRLERPRCLGQETPNCQYIALWKQSIRNHLYWSAASTQGGDGEVMAAKFAPITNHMQDIHVHGNPHFPACELGPLDPEDRGGKVYLNDGTIFFPANF